MILRVSSDQNDSMILFYVFSDIHRPACALYWCTLPGGPCGGSPVPEGPESLVLWIIANKKIQDVCCTWWPQLAGVQCCIHQSLLNCATGEYFLSFSISNHYSLCQIKLSCIVKNRERTMFIYISFSCFKHPHFEHFCESAGADVQTANFIIQRKLCDIVPDTHPKVFRRSLFTILTWTAGSVFPLQHEHALGQDSLVKTDFASPAPCLPAATSSADAFGACLPTSTSAAKLWHAAVSIPFLTCYGVFQEEESCIALWC